MALKTIYKSTSEAPTLPKEDINGPTYVGDRVGAIMKADAAEVHLFGYGVYQGDVLNDYMGVPNPKITLDNGGVVWGYQCWWGKEAKIKKIIGHRKVIDVPAPEKES